MRTAHSLLRTAGEPPVRPQHHRLRWIVLGLIVLAVPVVVALLALGGSAVNLANGTPALASLQPHNVAQTTLIYDRHGRLIARLHGAVDRIDVPSADIPRVLKQATVAVEDRRFYQHHGVDFQAIARAAVADLRSGRTLQGGSTITEQYVKNAYLDGDTTLTRKVHEAILAWQLEDKWSKDRILTAYLNTVYYGDGAYGVQAASQTYFHKSAARLTLAQAALLAGLPEDPSGYSPVYDPADALARRNIVLEDMARQGYITAAQERGAVKTKLRVFRATPPGGAAGGGVLRRLRRAAAGGALRRPRDARGRPAGHHDARPAHAGRRPQSHEGDAARGAGRRARVDRPGQRLHPRHDDHAQLAEGEVQPGLAGPPPARLGDETLRPDSGGRGGRGPGDDVLRLGAARTSTWERVRCRRTGT